MKTRIITLALAITLTLVATAAPAPVERDIVIYGDNSAAVAAAVQARRMGKSVVIVGHSSRVGGLTTGGLGQTDIGNRHVIGGISREFYRAVRDHYQKPEAWKWQNPEELRASKNRTEADVWWIFEPHVALDIYNGWLARDGIEYVKNARLDRSKNGIVKNGARIIAIRDEAGREYRGKVFIDATYEGDLMALAGITYTVGREANSLYGETLNGVQTAMDKWHQFFPGVDPYVRKGDPASGLLPFIDPTGPGVEGSGDKRVQAYCYRMCLTDHPENRIPFIKPDGYREDWYELLFRNIEAAPDLATVKKWIWINSPMPNRKTDTNNRGGFSTDFIGQNYDYPEADYATREQIARSHLLYQQGLMWSLAYHPRVPAEIREFVSRWGMTKDEFTEGGGWQGQLYVREARRMVSDLVMTQHHCQGRETVSDSIGMAAYTMDSHHVQRYVDKNGHVRNEGDVQVGKFPPYPVGYRSIVPRESECSNLIVPVCMSASHIAYGSIRMEPVFMVFGQSAATAAALAIEDNVSLQKVDYKKLRARLLKDGQILERPADSGTKTTAADAGELAKNLAALQARGIIQQPDYWLKNARPGKTCAGQSVATLIVNAVSKKKPGVTLDEACDYLHAAGLMSRPADWKRYAQKGKTCTGASTEKLIAALEKLTRPGK
ncbi:hypothetical protein M2103_001692 [Ereboglobus sp. PH5-5]|uniref:FAD-dependent oxidoreductase n=1 Tax=Ereboglobus sp. PH5-5 TaxID=2940529 RepID=UPI002407215A|nr:FAD-dependent oxidoreductase [Ereboglobus sp. PH5-5]MDF9833468.1 hypothetical protein [Ereboglobus sp. PH5-5]